MTYCVQSEKRLNTRTHIADTYKKVWGVIQVVSFLVGLIIERVQSTDFLSGAYYAGFFSVKVM